MVYISIYTYIKNKGNVNVKKEKLYVYNICSGFCHIIVWAFGTTYNKNVNNKL